MLIQNQGAVPALRAAAPAVAVPAADEGADAAVPVPEAADVAPVAGEAEVDVADAAVRVGGIGASPDPRSAASNIGDAHVPEYALSVDEDAHAEASLGAVKLLEPACAARSGRRSWFG